MKMTPISSTKQTPFTCLGIRKIFVCHEIWQSASLLGRRLPEYLIFIRQSKGWGWRINFVPLNAAWQSVLRILRVHYYGSQVYIHVEFPGPSTAKVVYPWDWHVVINKWLLKLTTCKFEWDKSSQDFCWSKKKRGQPSVQRPLGLSVCLR